MKPKCKQKRYNGINWHCSSPSGFLYNAILISEFCWVDTWELFWEIVEERWVTVCTDSVLSLDQEIVMSCYLHKQGIDSMRIMSIFLLLLTISLMAAYKMSGVPSPLVLQDRVCSNGVLSSIRGRLALHVSSLYWLYKSAQRERQMKLIAYTHTYSRALTFQSLVQLKQSFSFVNWIALSKNLHGSWYRYAFSIFPCYDIGQLLVEPLVELY